MSLLSQRAVYSNEAVDDNEIISDITVSQLLMTTSYLSNCCCRFFAASGQSYPAALQTLMNDDIISISHDALASLLQPIINVGNFMQKARESFGIIT